MPWTTVQASPEALDEAVADFESGVSSIDGFSITRIGPGQVVALLEYTA